MTTIAVGSKNPAKLQAVRTGFGEGDFEIQGVDSPSGVSHQPIGDQETRLGALNRARHALFAAPAAEFGIGLEGGVSVVDGAMYCFAWCAILHRDGRTGWASTGRCELPPRVADLVVHGMELGAADDLVFERTNSKQGDGAVGLLTGGRIGRATFYAPAVTMALARFLSAHLWETGQPSSGNNS